MLTIAVDGRVAVCELPGERVVRLPPGDGSRIVALVWSQDGKRLASGTEAGAVAFFDVS